MPVESLQTIHLGADGTGAILHQIYFRPAIGNMAKVFETVSGGRFPLSQFGEQWIRRSASGKGDGVQYINHQPDCNEQGWQGYNIAYRFENIDYLKLDLTGIGAKLTHKNAGREVKIDTRVKFSLVEDELNIVMPFGDLPDVPPPQGDLFGSVWSGGTGAASWLTKLFGGFRSGTALTFEEGYHWTNAKHSTPSSIVLSDFAINPILQAPDLPGVIRGLAKAKSLKGVDAVIGHLPGIKIEPRPVVRVNLSDHPEATE